VLFYQYFTGVAADPVGAKSPKTLNITALEWELAFARTSVCIL
jgi:hypothetical protein